MKLANIIKSTVLAATLGLTAVPAQAEFPEKPVEMTVLFGGTANTIAQLLSELMAQNLGQPVVPVGRTGGGGVIGYSHVQSTSPDGYNIVFNSNSVNTTRHLGTLPFGYDAFTPIAMVSKEVPALAVNASRGWNSLADMVAEVNASGKKLKVGISGKGSFTHLTSAALFDALGIGDKVIYISYGDGKAPIELLANRVDAAIQWPGQFTSYQQSGDLKVLAVTSAERIAVLPEVPTAMEQGAAIDITMWRGIAAPAGTPEDVIVKLEAAAQAAVASPRFVEASKSIGFEPAFAGHAAFGEVIAKDDVFYADLLSKLGSLN